MASLEDALRSCGLEWTILRPSGFATNAFAWIPSIREHRTVLAPFADVDLPVVDPLDIAAAAAQALTDGAHARTTYVLTGLAPASPRERTQTLADALRQPLGFEELSKDEAQA